MQVTFATPRGAEIKLTLEGCRIWAEANGKRFTTPVSELNDIGVVVLHGPTAEVKAEDRKAVAGIFSARDAALAAYEAGIDYSSDNLTAKMNASASDI